MSRHARRPVSITPAAPETAQLRKRRMQIIGDIQRLQWEFDKSPTLDVVRELREKRIIVNRLEEMIADIVQALAIVQLTKEMEEIGRPVATPATAGNS